MGAGAAIGPCCINPSRRETALTKYPGVKWPEVGEFAILACALSVVEFPFAVKTSMSRLKSRVLFSNALLVDVFMEMIFEVAEVVVVTAPKVA